MPFEHPLKGLLSPGGAQLLDGRLASIRRLRLTLSEPRIPPQWSAVKLNRSQD